MSDVIRIELPRDLDSDGFILFLKGKGYEVSVRMDLKTIVNGFNVSKMPKLGKVLCRLWTEFKLVSMRLRKGKV